MNPGCFAPAFSPSADLLAKIWTQKNQLLLCDPWRVRSQRAGGTTRDQSGIWPVLLGGRAVVGTALRTIRPQAGLFNPALPLSVERRAFHGKLSVSWKAAGNPVTCY